jgi:hypothetical protein
MHVRRAGGNDDGIETDFADFLVDELLSRLATHVLIGNGTMHAGHFRHFFGHFFAVHRSGNVFPAPTSKNADLHGRYCTMSLASLQTQSYDCGSALVFAVLPIDGLKPM